MHACFDYNGIITKMSRFIKVATKTYHTRQHMQHMEKNIRNHGWNISNEAYNRFIMTNRYMIMLMTPQERHDAYHELQSIATNNSVEIQKYGGLQYFREFRYYPHHWRSFKKACFFVPFFACCLLALGPIGACSGGGF